MYLIIIILLKEEILDDLLSILVELGCTDATVVESQSMEAFLASRLPIFAGLRFQLGGKNTYTKTILTVADDKNIGENVIKLLKDMNIDFNKGMGRIIVLKIESIFGEPQLPDII